MKLNVSVPWLPIIWLALVLFVPLRAGAQCTGDCDGNGRVSAAEVVLGARIAAGLADPTACAEFAAPVGAIDLATATHGVFGGCGLEVSAPQICFAQLGEVEPPPQDLMIRSSRGRWQAESSVPWASVTPAEGEGPAVVEVSIDRSLLGDPPAGVITVGDADESVAIRVGFTTFEPSEAPGWQLQVVEPVGASNEETTSLALDPAGAPGITYYRADAVIDRQLRYAHWNGCGWTIESVEKQGVDSSLAFDSKGEPHISFLGKGGMLRYASRVAGTWQAVTVEQQPPDGDTGERSSLALDADDLPHISYLLKFLPGGIFTYDLRYAHFDGESWVLETADPMGTTGWDTPRPRFERAATRQLPHGTAELEVR